MKARGIMTRDFDIHGGFEFLADELCDLFDAMERLMRVTQELLLKTEIFVNKEKIEIAS